MRSPGTTTLWLLLVGMIHRDLGQGEPPWCIFPTRGFIQEQRHSPCSSRSHLITLSGEDASPFEEPPRADLEANIQYSCLPGGKGGEGQVRQEGRRPMRGMLSIKPHRWHLELILLGALGDTLILPGNHP